MANQIQVSNTAFATQGSWTWTLPQNSGAIVLNGQGHQGKIQNIGTSAEDLDYGDISSANAGLLFMRNLDATNYVSWGLNDSGTIKKVGRLNPAAEMFTQIRVEPGQQIMLQANVAACNVEYYLLRN